MTFSSSERKALAQSLLDKGPDAPTLCEGWTTRDLAEHLRDREQLPLSKLRSLVPIGGGDEQPEAGSYEDVVRNWAAGPSGLNPWRILDRVANGVEHFVHHEDVRRGALAPGDPVDERELPEEHQRYLYRTLKLMAGRVIKADRPVILAPEGFERIIINEKPGVSADGEAVIRISGGVGEFVLWAFGRNVVNLEVSGDDSSVKRLNL